MQPCERSTTRVDGEHPVECLRRGRPCHFI